MERTTTPVQNPLPFCGSVWDYGCQHATYNVHLVRDLTLLSEEQQQNWAEQMKDLLLLMKAAVEQAHAKGHPALHPLEVADWQAQYQAVLLQGEAAQPRELSPSPRAKGRRKQRAARNLLAFLHNLAVPFDNNLAE